MECLALLAQEVKPEFQVLQDRGVSQVLLVLEDPAEKQGHLDRQVPLDQEETEVSKDHQAHQELWVPRDQWDHEDNPDQLDPRVLVAHVVNPVHKAHQAIVESQDLQAHLGLQDPQAQKVKLDNEEHLEAGVHLDFQVHLAKEENQVCLDQLAQMEGQDQQVHQDPEVKRDQKVNVVMMVDQVSINNNL